jgi:hypothetical protein
MVVDNSVLRQTTIWSTSPDPMRYSDCAVSGSGQLRADIALPLLAHAPRSAHVDSNIVKRRVRATFNFFPPKRLLPVDRWLAHVAAGAAAPASQLGQTLGTAGAVRHNLRSRVGMRLRPREALRLRVRLFLFYRY